MTPLEGNLKKWVGGSVAGAIWVYREIKERNLDKDYKNADFGLRNSENSWLPFGRSYYSKRTIKEYFDYIYMKRKGNVNE